ncbi:aa3-type cytochrome c oxidase subunit IV [Fulvimarina sp. MAC3]|uniref:aa3-type cytochrome c oxidase subunit IV n=1 Tax=Fulvimarina sp. MAC3 TaxID=3148887 RepID=UPI0031FDBFCF
MATLPSYDTNSNADMDYREHERTYALFLTMFKWGAIFVVALLIAMAVSLLGSGGILGGLGAFVIVFVIAYFLNK